MKDLFEDLQDNLNQLIEQDVSVMDDIQLKQHRKNIVSLQKQCNKALGNTSKKEHNYDDALVIKYIEQVLKDGYNLKATKLSSNQELVEAQHLTWWKDHIKVCVSCSPFSKESFTNEYLQMQRNAIENSTTLHELRQNVKLMIEPLRMYREFTQPIELDYDLPTIDSLLLENEELRKEVEEKTRVIKEITKLYDDGLKDYKEKIDLLKAIEQFKAEHNCSDTDACAIFNVSRSSFARLKKEVSKEA